MMLAVDVSYKDNRAHVAGVTFTDWAAAEPDSVITSLLDNVADYEPGQFYKRELPCILNLLMLHSLHPECIVVDGYVYLDGDKEPGLGKHLYDALHGNCAVIGVAKERFNTISEQYEVFRANSNRALYVTAAGIGIEQAKTLITSMHGNYRIPTLLKVADQASRGWKL